MDNIDVKILDCLRQNARENASVIGEKVNMSVSAVIERIRKMENAGIIRQYTVVIDPKQIDKDVTAIISVGIEHPKYNDGLISFVQKSNEVMECHYVTGDFDFLLKVVTDSIRTFEHLLNDIKCIPGVSMTKTLVVLSTVKNTLTVMPELPQPPK